MDYRTQNVNEYTDVLQDNIQQNDFLDEELDILRDITKLNPIAYAKVLKARKQAERLQDLYMKYEPNDSIGVDYSVANDLELSLRKQALMKKVEKDWKNYIAIENDEYGLSEYIDDILKHKIQSQQQKSK